jgi:hypothetical protein
MVFSFILFAARNPTAQCTRSFSLRGSRASERAKQGPAFPRGTAFIESDSTSDRQGLRHRDGSTPVLVIEKEAVLLDHLFNSSEKRLARTRSDLGFIEYNGGLKISSI